MDVKVQVEMEKNIINKYKVRINNEGTEAWYKPNPYLLYRKNNPEWISFDGHEEYRENYKSYRKYGCLRIYGNGHELYNQILKNE